MRYINEFLTTVLDFEEEDKLSTAIGAALYHDPSVKGKVFVLYGEPGTGKTSILQPLSIFTGPGNHFDPNIIIRDNIDILKWETKNDDKVRFCSTNKLSDILPENYVVIKMRGDRMPFENYKKFQQEMLYFPEEFFKGCMKRFTLNKYGGFQRRGHYSS